MNDSIYSSSFLPFQVRLRNGDDPAIGHGRGREEPRQVLRRVRGRLLGLSQEEVEKRDLQRGRNEKSIRNMISRDEKRGEVDVFCAPSLGSKKILQFRSNLKAKTRVWRKKSIALPKTCFECAQSGKPKHAKESNNVPQCEFQIKKHLLKMLLYCVSLWFLLISLQYK